MRVDRIVVVLAFLLCWPGVATATQQDELTKFLQPIQEAADRLTSFSSEFIQERELALFTEPVIFRGRLTVVRPDRLRWEFVSPAASVLIFSGDSGLRCDANGKPISFTLGSDPIMHEVAKQLWLWLGGDYKKLASVYTMERKGENGLILHPLDTGMAGYIERVELTFDPVTHQPDLVEIIEPGGDATRIRFL